MFLFICDLLTTLWRLGFPHLRIIVSILNRCDLFSHAQAPKPGDFEGEAAFWTKQQQSSDTPGWLLLLCADYVVCVISQSSTPLTVLQLGTLTFIA